MLPPHRHRIVMETAAAGMLPQQKHASMDLVANEQQVISRPPLKDVHKISVAL
jgi:hypothetical protein